MKRRQGVVLFALAIWLAGAALACGPASPTPTPTPAIAVTDDAGRTITLSKIPQRIVSLAPSNTEILYALGLGEKVVGVSDSSDYPPEAKAKPKVSSGLRVTLEEVVRLSPELVVAAGITNPEEVAQLEKLGLKVLILNAPKDIDGVLTQIGLVGRATGTEAAAAALTKAMADKLAALAPKVQGATRPRVFYEIDASNPVTPWTAGPGSFVDDLLRRAGAVNVASGAKAAWAEFSSEEILRANPDIIVLADAPYGITVDSVKARPGWATIAAVQKGAIYPLDENQTSLLSRPGPRIVDGLEALMRLIHPESFKQ